MNVICGKEALLKGTQIVQSVVSPRSTLPILSNFLFEAEGQKIKLSATDLEIGVSCFVTGEIVKEGSITIPAKRFCDIIRELPDDTNIEIKADESNQITVKCGKSRFVLMGLPKSDYPVLPAFPEDKTFTIAQSQLKNMLRRTSFAVSSDETRYVLNGVYLIAEEGGIKLVATDGRRLAYTSKDNIDKKANYRAIMPAKAVNEAQRVLAAQETDGEVTVAVTENQIAFRINSITVISRLIEGTFPNYDQVIPKKHERQIKLKVKETLSAARQVSMLSSEKSAPIKFTFGKNMLRVSAVAQGLGSGEVEIDIEHSGSTLEIAFNPQFIIDILKNIDEEEVFFELTNSLVPALLKPVKDTSYLCVIMPLRT